MTSEQQPPSLQDEVLRLRKSVARLTKTVVRIETRLCQFLDRNGGADLITPTRPELQRKGKNQ